MRVDADKSEYHEALSARDDFSRQELRRLRLLLRRLRFLEKKIEETDGVVDGAGTGGQVFAEREADALRWTLSEIGFLDEVPRIKH